MELLNKTFVIEPGNQMDRAKTIDRISDIVCLYNSLTLISSTSGPIRIFGELSANDYELVAGHLEEIF